MRGAGPSLWLEAAACARALELADARVAWGEKSRSSEPITSITPVCGRGLFAQNQGLFGSAEGLRVLRRRRPRVSEAIDASSLRARTPHPLRARL